MKNCDKCDDKIKCERCALRCCKCPVFWCTPLKHFAYLPRVKRAESCKSSKNQENIRLMMRKIK